MYTNLAAYFQSNVEVSTSDELSLRRREDTTKLRAGAQTLKGLQRRVISLMRRIVADRY